MVRSRSPRTKCRQKRIAGQVANRVPDPVLIPLPGVGTLQLFRFFHIFLCEPATPSPGPDPPRDCTPPAEALRWDLASSILPANYCFFVNPDPDFGTLPDPHGNLDSVVSVGSLSHN